MVLMVPVYEDDPRVGVVEFATQPGQVVPTFTGERPVAKVAELDYSPYLVLLGSRQQHVLPVQVVAVGGAADQEPGGGVGALNRHETIVSSGPPSRGYNPAHAVRRR